MERERQGQPRYRRSTRKVMTIDLLNNSHSDIQLKIKSKSNPKSNEKTIVNVFRTFTNPKTNRQTIKRVVRHTLSI